MEKNKIFLEIIIGSFLATIIFISISQNIYSNRSVDFLVGLFAFFALFIFSYFFICVISSSWAISKSLKFLPTRKDITHALQKKFNKDEAKYVTSLMIFSFSFIFLSKIVLPKFFSIYLFPETAWEYYVGSINILLSKNLEVFIPIFISVAGALILFYGYVSLYPLSHRHDTSKETIWLSGIEFFSNFIVTPLIVLYVIYALWGVINRFTWYSSIRPTIQHLLIAFFFLIIIHFHIYIRNKTLVALENCDKYENFVKSKSEKGLKDIMYTDSSNIAYAFTVLILTISVLQTNIGIMPSGVLLWFNFVIYSEIALKNAIDKANYPKVVIELRDGKSLDDAILLKYDDFVTILQESGISNINKEEIKSIRYNKFF